MCVTPFKFLSFWERSSTPRTCSLSINQTYFQLYSCSSSPAELLSHGFVFLDFNSWHVMAGAKIRRETWVMWKKVQKPLADWVERLFGVWSTLFLNFCRCVWGFLSFRWEWKSSWKKYGASFQRMTHRDSWRQFFF